MEHTGSKSQIPEDVMLCLKYQMMICDHDEKSVNFKQFGNKTQQNAEKSKNGRVKKDDNKENFGGNPKVDWEPSAK